jgi:hypothetical protein
MTDRIGADGIIPARTVPFDELRAVVHDDFNLKGAPIVIHLMRCTKGRGDGFRHNGFHERGMILLS